MKFDWKILLVAIIMFAAVVSIKSGYSKWIFAIVMLGILLSFGEKTLK